MTLMSGEPVIPPGSRAVLIGVSRYQDAEYRSYMAVGNSVEGMYRLLVESGLCGWRSEQVETISDPVDAGRLLVRLRSLAEATTGALLLYFVGHGVPSKYTGELCLAIADTDHANPDATGLEYTKIKRMLYGETPAATRIAILDCCYSGLGIGLGTADDGTQLAELSQYVGTYTLTAADGRAHTPPDGDGNPRTAFTGELLDLLMNDGVPDGPADLTLGAIFPHLRRRLVTKGLPRPNQRSDDTAAAFVFARNTALLAADLAPDNHPQRQHADASPSAQAPPLRPRESLPDTAIERDDPLTRPTAIAESESPTDRKVSRRAVLMGLGGVTASIGLILGVAALAKPTGGTQQTSSDGSDKYVSSRVVTARSAITLDQNAIAIAFSPDGKTIIAVTEVGFTFWDVAKHVQVATLTEPGSDTPISPTVIAISPDGRIIATGDSEEVNLWDAHTHQKIDTFINYSTIPDAYSLVFSPDNKTVGVAGAGDIDDGSVASLWNIATPDAPPIKLRGRIDFNHLIEPNGTPLDGQLTSNSVAFSPDGSLVATGQAGRTSNRYTHTQGYAGSLQLWDAHTCRNVATLTASDPIYGLAFNPDGKTLASAGEAGVTLWRLSDHKKLSTNAVDRWQSDGDDRTTMVAFSPNGKILAGVADDVVMLWNLVTNTQITLDTNTGSYATGSYAPLKSVAFSPDSKLLATGGGKFLLWPIS